MGCEVQIHEKTDSRGTWAYHSIDGWYLNTSTEHYRVDNCHSKHTKSKRLSDTVHFQHKNITNPSISPADKLMLALANCKEVLAGHLKGKHQQQIGELQQLVDKVMQHSLTALKQQTSDPRVVKTPQPTAVPRVDETTNTNAFPRVGKTITPQHSPPPARQTTNELITHLQEQAH